MLKFKTTILYVAVFGLGALAMWFATHTLNGSHNYAEQMKAHHGSSEEGQVNHSHDEVNMPGLQGKDTTENEVDDLKTIFKNHKQITRTVENISSGITTTTETTDDKLRDALVSHVVTMVARLEEKRNPKIIIQSPTLDKLFAESDAIQTNITMTELGIVVTQTSTNPIVVKTLQTHAAEVSNMANRGMEAVHERMLN
ncbi:MAG: hypothetical protein OSA07_05170 [Pseudomonadales bacterium]|nr:hypothetical protein [Pseudomonadales bacterium]